MAVTSSPVLIENLDITCPAHKANPFLLYERLRNENPVCAVRMLDGQTAWLVTRYDDVVAVLKDERYARTVSAR